MADKSRYMSAQEAAVVLGVEVATVYAYVSRGLIRSEALGGSKRTRRYHREDVERLKARQEQRKNPDHIAETALDWGAPLLDSSLTLIAGGQLYYRGQDAIRLAQEQRLEAVAALLWTGDIETDITFSGAAMSRSCQDALEKLSGARFDEQFQALLPLAAVEDLRAYDLRPATVIQTGASILRLLVGIAARQTVIRDSMAQTLADAWAVDAERLLNMALVLCVDHELNVSSFTARCVASAGSNPYAAVIGGLAALQGTRHGGSTERVMAMLREIGQGDVRQVLANRLRRGEALLGFGHRLYPAGDPRGRLLLDSLVEAYPKAEAVAMSQMVCAAVKDLTDLEPNIDFALVILAETLDLPEGAPLALFAMGRTVGWIGHALEQYAEDRLIRPRARYVGMLPEG